MDVFVSVIGENLIALWTFRVLEVSFDPVSEAVIVDDMTAFEQFSDGFCLL